MSVLTRPQGTPDRVWSYVAGLTALGGEAPRAEAEGLFNPGYLRHGRKVASAASLAADTHGAATSLRFVEGDRQTVRLADAAPFAGLADFADALHDRLCAAPSDDTNRVMLETYAWFAAESDRQGSLVWIFETANDVLANRANEGLQGDDEDGHFINPTKMTAWRRWMAALGLMVKLPLPKAPDYPLASVRIARELRRGGAAPGDRLLATDFLRRMAERQPYLDTGRLYLQAAARIGHVPRTARLSPLLSAALRDLHTQGALELTLAGDSSEPLVLTGDEAHPVRAFTTVAIQDLEAVA